MAQTCHKNATYLFSPINTIQRYLHLSLGTQVGDKPVYLITEWNLHNLNILQSSKFAGNIVSMQTYYLDISDIYERWLWTEESMCKFIQIKWQSHQTAKQACSTFYMEQTQACSTFYMEQTTLAKLGLHKGNMKHNSQSKLVKCTYNFTHIFI